MLSSRAQWTPNLEALSKIRRPVVVESFAEARAPMLRVARLDAGHAVNLVAAGRFDEEVASLIRAAARLA